ncbi:hypothetical protein B0H66DRAFT_588840 [Apodospora peruviana]|uniref:Uncharacterized protein n=1 Tax=Apodospora peruviana TaxID=516989 RepID=A0AAE0IJN9_9PEZI|nr:hypothetical protein B0H66DRAFT_588840 [Apodospora peruviana]
MCLTAFFFLPQTFHCQHSTKCPARHHCVRGCNFRTDSPPLRIYLMIITEHRSFVLLFLGGFLFMIIVSRLRLASSSQLLNSTRQSWPTNTRDICPPSCTWPSRRLPRALEYYRRWLPRSSHVEDMTQNAKFPTKVL